MTVALLALSYLLGSVPTSYWVGRALHDLDLREHGSGNLGTTNAFRVLGWKAAIPVILVDVGKGFVPVTLFPGLVDASFGWTLAFGAAAIFGHMFSVWARFKGGKGIATSAGVFLSLAPLALMVALAVWALLTLRSRIASIGSLGATVSLPVLVALTPHQGGRSVVVFAGALAVCVVLAHRSNIDRLLRGEENRFERDPLEGGPPPLA